MEIEVLGWRVVYEGDGVWLLPPRQPRRYERGEAMALLGIMRAFVERPDVGLGQGAPSRQPPA
jgi:hypothetical protein